MTYEQVLEQYNNENRWKPLCMTDHKLIACRYAESKTQELQAWKESAMQVMNAIDLQAIGKEIGVPLGEDVSSKVLPWIREAKERKGLFTEEQVREAVSRAFVDNDATLFGNKGYAEFEDEIINKIKQK